MVDNYMCTGSCCFAVALRAIQTAVVQSNQSVIFVPSAQLVETHFPFLRAHPFLRAVGADCMTMGTTIMGYDNDVLNT